MPTRPSEAFSERQAQWDAFHRWEVSRQVIPLSVEQRVAWYNAAHRFTRNHAPAPFKDLQNRVKELRDIRQGLACLGWSLHNG